MKFSRNDSDDLKGVDSGKHTSARAGKPSVIDLP